MEYTARADVRAGGPPVAGKDAGGADRHRSLGSMAAEVLQLRQELAVGAEHLRHLIDLEAVRPLTDDEDGQVRRLHVETGSVRQRLRELRRDLLTQTRTPTPPAGATSRR